ncbi:MAG: GDSL-type esterase/lipase family protein [Planctomycetota bacterium]
MSADEKEQAWADDLARFEREDRARPPAPGGIVCVGSSTFTFWGEAMARDLAPLPVVNRGFGGSSTPDVLALMDRIVLPLAPSVVVFYCGDNDIGGGATAQTVAANYRTFVTRTRTALPDAKHLFVSIKPSPAREALWPVMAEANRLVRTWAEAQADVGYVDTAAAMLTADGAPRPELFVDDRLHMNRDGYAIWAPLLRDAIERIR